MGDVAWVAIGTFIGLVVAAVTAGIIRIMTASGQIRSVDRKDAAEEWQQIFNVQQTDLLKVREEREEDRKKIDALEERDRECALQVERLLAWQYRAMDWIEGVQEAMVAKDMPFRKFKIEPPPAPPPVKDGNP